MAKYLVVIDNRINWAKQFAKAEVHTVRYTTLSDQFRISLLKRVFIAAEGSSISTRVMSWLNLLVVTPMSVFMKKDKGVLFRETNQIAVLHLPPFESGHTA